MGVQMGYGVATNSLGLISDGEWETPKPSIPRLVWFDGRLIYSHSHGFRLLRNRCGIMGVRSGHLEAGRPVHFWVFASRDFEWIRER